MKQFFLVYFAILVLPHLATAQDKRAMNDKQNIVVETNQEPFFPKGEVALYELINSSIVYSDDMKANKLSGTLALSFDVKNDSSIVNAMVIQGVEPSVDEQVKKIIEKLKFAPAIQNGFKMKMNIMMNFPIQAH